MVTDLDINLVKRVVNSLDDLQHGLYRLLQLKLAIGAARGEGL